MSRTVAKRLAILVTIIVWPAFFAWLSEMDEARGSMWLALHQAYYLPFSWLGPPLLFTADSSSGFSVQSTGRALALFVYVLLFYVVIRVLDRGKGGQRQ
jgi:hypothetical protein